MTTAGAEQLSCQELVELVTDYLEGALASEEHERFERHVGAGNCTGCAEYLRQMRTTVELAGRLRPEDVSPEAERALLHAFRDWTSGASV
ncbi:MAG TPA: zf-HC2 domain-containing protein [Gaiellaceae bacterium]|nr:zf-HC2 domain-containing protein [Gaiellaceae bacterium]